MVPASRFVRLLCLLVIGAMFSSRVDANDDSIAFFESKIRPVLVRHCYECHSKQAESVEGGLLLDARAGLLAGGDSGPAILPGRGGESLLIEAIRYEGLEMPPAGKLPDRVIADFETWINRGAVDPRAGQASRGVDSQVHDVHDFWSFQEPRRAPPLERSEPGWPLRAIDTFVLARQEAAGLAPSVVADRRVLIRRVTFDLLGLPPTPEEVDAFASDDSPLAYPHLVDRLLASPHYGERWARMWLDVARYAEDQAHIVGKDSTLFYPNAYLYRDWVIGAWNRDIPYDKFVMLQLAADIWEGAESSDHVALGFLGLGPKYYRRDAPEVMADEWEDRVDTVSRGLLGLTVACARCHDHKYDPIPTEDYYALAGVFASSDMFNRPLDEEREKDEDGQAKKPSDAAHIVREAKPQDLRVMIRGDFERQGRVVPRRFLQVLSKGAPEPFSSGSGRMELASAIASTANPLTARVLVNRIWALHFGEPIVATTSNFGKLGDPPTHPELLDDLAVRFMESGWSMKWLQREIVMSATYQQSSATDASKSAIDPANRWLWRMNRKRLDIESWRDTVLFASGTLDRRIGGNSIEPDDPETRRRTVYSRISRLDLNRLLALFDFPDPNAHSARRVATTTPLQKLFVLNSPLIVGQSDRLAVEILAGAGEESERIDLIYRTLYGRRPSAEESALGLAFLTSDPPRHQELWSQYAQALVAANELMMVD
jgi:hypothetical protein